MITIKFNVLFDVISVSLDGIFVELNGTDIIGLCKKRFILFTHSNVRVCILMGKYYKIIYNNELMIIIIITKYSLIFEQKRRVFNPQIYFVKKSTSLLFYGNNFSLKCIDFYKIATSKSVLFQR